MEGSVLGRFNFLSVKTDLYNVVYLARENPTFAAVIAQEVSRDVALNMIRDLNRALDNASYDLYARRVE